MNLRAVEVRVIRVFESNMLQYLQSSDMVGDSYDRLIRVGNRAAYKLIKFKEQKTNEWQTHALDISELIKVEPGALYRVQFRMQRPFALYACQEPDTDGVIGDEEWENIAASQHAQEERNEKEYWEDEMYDWRSDDYYYSWRHEDDPCYDMYYRRNKEKSIQILGSNIGLIVKEGENDNYLAVVTSW